MKVKKYAVVLLFFLTDCAGLRSLPPRAGQVEVINPNIGAYANCRLFNGNWSENKLIATDEQGYPQWAMPLAKMFTIKSATCTYAHYSKILQLSSPASYTLYVIWTRFTGKMLDRSIIHFQTTGRPFNDLYIDRYGQKTYADKFVRLPRVNTSGLSQLKIHATIPVAEYLGTLIGIR